MCSTMVCITITHRFTDLSSISASKCAMIFLLEISWGSTYIHSNMYEYTYVLHCFKAKACKRSGVV